MLTTKGSVNKDEPSLGGKVKFYRQRLNMSQLKLENQAGLSLGMISRVENDLVYPSVETLWKIADALDLNSKEIAYLFKINLYNTTEKMALNKIH